jgi:hypothetical protein
LIVDTAPLPHVDYPVDLTDIVVVGYRSATARSFTIRPVQPGTYVLAVWPRYFPLARWVWRRTLVFADAAGPPRREIFDAGAERPRGVDEWSWSLTRQELGTMASLAAAVFGAFSVARGELHFEAGPIVDEVRTLAWSCHQPFATENGRAVLEPTTTEIFDWYRQVIDDFAPHVVWGEGDTGYSDGTPATDFTGLVYDHPGWQEDRAMRIWLTDAYRRMYRYHWSFPGMQDAMRRYAHVLTWDDHEIHDGFGSEDRDFSDENVAMFEIARGVAEEYVLNIGPRVRQIGDAHQAYISGPQASFIFDTRSSRRYADPGGRVVSQQQLDDFRAFCNAVVGSREVGFLFLATPVPFLYIKDFWESLGAKAPKPVTDLASGVRDDLRDSWLAPGNQDALKQLLDIVRDLLWQRPGLHVVNVSGDIHVSNAFQLWPAGFPRPIYQVTTSAITNRGHLPDLASEIMSLDTVQLLPVLGFVRKLWAEVTDPNVLCITTTTDRAVLHLRVLPVEGSAAVDRELVLD